MTRTPANGFANPLRTTGSLDTAGFERFEPLFATHKRNGILKENK